MRRIQQHRCTRSVQTEFQITRKVTEGGHWAWRGDRNLPPRRQGKAQTNPTSTAAEACI